MLNAIISLIAALGVGGLIGAITTAVLTRKREHQRWILDNKKLEWRELIDTLHAALFQMGYAFQEMRVYKPGEEGDVQSAVSKGSRVIRDRIFIADAIQRHQVLEQWKELVAYIDAIWSPRGPGQPTPTLNEFDGRKAAFENKLLLIAREDLNL
jgi:hypothetical protein